MIPDGEHTQVARSLKRQRFLVRNAREISFLAFGLVLSIVLTGAGIRRTVCGSFLSLLFVLLFVASLLTACSFYSAL